MGLVKKQPVLLYDLSMVKRGDLLWGRHRTWNEGKAGIVTAATETQLIVQYHPGIGNVTNHFIIPVSEAAEGQWEIRWSSDMTEIYEYGIGPEEPEVSEEPGEQDGLKNLEKLGGSENLENKGGDGSDPGGTDS